MKKAADWAQTAMFTASEVEVRTGVPASTLRQWERRYGFPRPIRNDSGYRLYSPEDVRDIGLMKEHLRRGVSASRAAELTLGGVPVGAETPPSSSLVRRTEPDLPVQPDELSERLTAALVAADTARASAVLAEAHAHLPIEDVLMRVMTPTLVEIGAMWARGEITVAHEHGASAFLRSRLSALMDIAGVQEGLGPLVVAACAPGEQHELGLMMLTLALRRRGVRVAYLGADLPVAAMIAFAREQGAQGLLLAVNGEWALEALRPARQQLRALGLPVFLGGALLNARPELAAELGGLYAGPDAPHAASFIAGTLDRPVSTSTHKTHLEEQP
jgi:DNA-binding transcriptional MerR regulator